MTTINGEHEWLAKQDTSKYKDQWIAVLDKKIVGHHKTQKRLQAILKKKGIDDQRPLYMMIPDGYITLKNIVGKEGIKNLMMLF